MPLAILRNPDSLLLLWNQRHFYKDRTHQLSESSLDFRSPTAVYVGVRYINLDQKLNYHI